MDRITGSPGPISKRRYMSKSQRPCDFCRLRKAACRIENRLPCKLCRSYDRVCTFNEPARNSRRNPIKAANTNPPGSDTEDQNLQATNVDDQGPPDVSDIPGVSWSAEVDLAMPSPVNDFQNETDFFSQLDAFTLQENFLPPVIQDDFADDHSNYPNYEAVFAEGSDTSTTRDFDLCHPFPAASSNKSATTATVSQLCGLTGDMDPFLLSYYRFDSTGTFHFKRLAIHSAFDGIHPIQFLISPATTERNATEAGSEPDADRAQLNDIVNAQVGHRLIQLFYRFVLPQFPILTTASKPNPEGTPAHLLAAIYLVAQSFASFDDYLCIQTVYDTLPLKQLADISMSALRKDTSEPNVSHVQTALLLLIAPPDNPLIPDSCGRWALMGTIVTMAQSLGLFHDAAGWNLPSEQVILRRRLSWAVRCADTWFAASLGRIPLITDANWMVSTLTSEDFSDEEAALGAYEVFGSLARLSQILISVSDKLFSLRAVQELSVDFRITLRTAHPLMDQLTQWYQSIQDQRPIPPAADVDFSGILHLGYHAIKCMILRAIFRPFHNIEKGLVPHCYDILAEEEALKHLRGASKRALSAFTTFTATLTNSRIHAFWPFWSVTVWSSMGQLAILLLLTARSDEEAEQCKASLDYTRRVLRLQSRSLDILRFSLLRIDSLHWKGFNKVFNLVPEVQRALYP